MGQSASIVLAAGAIVALNEVIFAPAADAATYTQHFNWRIVPATGVLALTLTAFEKATPSFAVGLASLTLLGVLILPVGKAPSPAENIAKTLGLD